MPKRFGFLLSLGLMLALGAIVACGGSAAPAVERFTPGAPAASSDATSVPAVAPTEAVEAMATVPAGSVTMAMRNLRSGAGTPRFCTAGCAETVYLLAILETLTGVEAGPGGALDPQNIPMLAKSWELSADQKTMDFVLEEGIMFHKDWGEMTAEDVAFSYNDANAFTTPESIHGQAGDFAPLIANVEALDKYTVRFNFQLFHQAMPLRYMGPFYQSAGIVPKKAFDELGPDGMREVYIGTGPFIFDEWKKSESLIAHAVDEHWRKVPAVKEIRILDIPEGAARTAMLETGEAQIAGELPYKDVVRLQKKGFKLQRDNGRSLEQGMFFSGNYWETKHPVSGKVLTRTFVDKPWIGKFGDAESMENARKVRIAMSMALDRQGIKDSLTEGLGEDCYLIQISTQQAEWKDRWEMPYDPEGAKKLLAEAGYLGFAARTAMLETGEAQIAGELPYKDVVRLQKKGFKLQRDNGRSLEQGMFFSGNYWETKHPVSGKVLTRTFVDKPWIGKFGDAESMENARKVRIAMSMALDRQGIKDSLTEGLGEDCYLIQISTQQAEWKDRWEMPYDPEGAKKLLAEAGYPNGFEAELWVGPGGFTAELGDAIAGLWLKNLNVNTIVDRITYTKFRPTLVQRSNTQIYSSAGDEGKTGFPVHWPKGFQGSSLTDGGWGPGFEDPFYTDMLFKMNAINEPADRLPLAEEYFDHVFETGMQPCVIQIPYHPIYDPNQIAEWKPFPNMNGNLSGAAAFETIVLK